ncbi:MAG: RluA family pseudouridine synthase [Treponema sp.]|nr:RluA family pseudouridine synthase [Treponema sp.]
MFAPFSQEEAKAKCQELCAQLDTGIVCLQQITAVSSERRDQGVMLGVLLCRNADGNEVVLKTVSGISKQLAYVHKNDIPLNEVLVPPVVDAMVIADSLAKNDAEIHRLTYEIGACHKHGSVPQKLIQQRKRLTQESLDKVYALYSFCCADGSVRTLGSIAKEYYRSKKKNPDTLPPTGTGDCCAPKLLHYAFSHQLVPFSMCEMYYGAAGESKGRINGEVYPPCDERCGILLPAMLGLRILYRDKDIIVVNKQSGVLSVPGRGPDKQDCIVNRVRRLFPDCIEQPSIHRLDMETSGLLVLAFTKEAHRAISRQFEDGLVQKKYEALLDGVLAKKGIASDGTMELFFRLDVDNRPHQIWDAVYGKKAITEWHVLDVEKYHAPDGSVRNATRVMFVPHTGRTHQLRLASADSHGFAIPIIGDTLYGTCAPGERLCLHATYLRFTHPTTGTVMEFESESEF